MAAEVAARDHRRMQPTAAVSSQADAVSRVHQLADASRRAPARPAARADARVRRYRLARLQLDDAARGARHAHLRAAHD